MKMKSVALGFCCLATGFLAEAASLPTRDSSVRSTRPDISVYPKTLPVPLPVKSPRRNRTCHVRGGTGDDAKEILNTLKSCNGGGHAIFENGTTYTVGEVLDLRFLKNIDIEIPGTLTFSNDTDYWQRNAIKYEFQDATAFFAIGGHDVNVFGGGLIEGNGQFWWDLWAENKTLQRPLLFNVDGLQGGTVSNLRMRNSPKWFNLIQNSKGVVVDNITMDASSISKNPAKNTDGWDTYRSSNIVIQNSRVDNTDDCVSFKPNSTQILVQNLWCNGSHGISVGSLGQYVGKVDIVEDITVYNISMNNASDAARIKVFPGAPNNTAKDSGGGDGHVCNIVYEQVDVANVDWAIELTECYTMDGSSCDNRPTNFTISDIVFKDFTGVTSKKNQPHVASLVCPSSKSCSNITAQNVQVKSPLGSNDAICSNLDTKSLGLNCTS